MYTQIHESSQGRGLAIIRNQRGRARNGKMKFHFASVVCWKFSILEVYVLALRSSLCEPA